MQPYNYLHTPKAVVSSYKERQKSWLWAFALLTLSMLVLTASAHADGTRIDDYEGVHIDKCQCVVWAQKFANAKYGSVIPPLGANGGARLIWEDSSKHPSNATQITNAPGLLPNKDDIVVFSGAVDASTGGYGHVGIVYQVNSRTDVVLVDTNWNGDELGYTHSVNLNWTSVYGWFHENSNPNGSPNSITRYPGTNPASGDIKNMLIAAGQKYKIPPHILFGIAYQESGWRQYGSDGYTLVSGDGGIGIMQLTGATAAQFDVNRLASDIAYNIDCGASVLNGKWNVTPIIGDNDRAKLENWYYAIWAYNGFVQGSTYPGTILNLIAQNPIGQWQQVAVTPPSASDIGWPARRIANTPSPIHVDANFDGIIDGTVTPPPSVSFNEGNKNKWFGPGSLSAQIVSWSLQDQGGGRGGFSQAWDHDDDNNLGTSPQFPNSTDGNMQFGYLDSSVREGQHTVYIRAWNSDHSRYTDYSSGWYGYDSAAPTVKITSAQTAGATYSSPQHVVWHIDDPSSGIKSWGQGWDADPGSSQYSTSDGNLDLPAGTHTLHVHTMDNVGNEKDWTFGPYTFTPQVQVGQRSDWSIDQRFVDCYNRVGASVVGSVLNNNFVHTAIGNGNGNGLAQDFIDGNGAKDIITAKDGATQAFDVCGNTWIWYSSQNFASGQAGFPTGDLNQITASTTGFDTPGTSQAFEGGIVYDSKYGTHEIPQDVIGNMQLATLVSFIRGTFGFPITDFVTCYTSPFGTTGRQDYLEHGAIYSGSGSVGAHVVSGMIYNKYAEVGEPWSGGTPSVLGFPTSDVSSISSSFGTAGQVGQFEGGNIYSTGTYGVHPVYGGIYKQYTTAGASGGKYGFPISDPYNWQSGTRQDFEGGSLMAGLYRTHLLWNNTDGRVMLWSVAADGSITVNGFGPFTDNAPNNKWSATAVATGKDGLSHILWNNTDSRVMLWTVDDSGNVLGYAGFGPYTDTYVNSSPSNVWHATAVSVGPDNLVHLLWNNVDHRVMLWNVDSSFNVQGVTGYGPFTDNSVNNSPGNVWTATALATGPDNVSRIAWNNVDHRVMLWAVAPNGGVMLAGYGPYTDNFVSNDPGNLWSAVGVSVGPDDVTHLLWGNVDRRAMLWSLDGAFNAISISGYGPYTDNAAQNLWSAAGLATGPDNVSHLLWDNTDFRAMLWGMDSAGNIGVSGYGPYTDNYVSNSPGNLWSATAVSAGP